MIFKKQEQLSPEIDVILPVAAGSKKADEISSITGISSIDFEGNFKEIKPVYTAGRSVYLLGLGEPKNDNNINEAFRSLGHKYKKEWKGEVQLTASGFTPDQINKAVLGMEMAEYRIGAYKTDKADLSEITCKVSGPNVTQQIMDEAQATAQTINRIKELVDAPAARKTPEFLANWAMESGKAFGYEVEVFEQERLEKEGFGCLLAVGRGSEHESRLIVQTWNPDQTETPDIVLVGKGITFDTGGLSIKPSQNLHYMKSDMGGAAAVLGTLELAARLGIKKHIVGVVASAENAVDAKSYRPGDVITSYSGKTVEIINTDAEGRLALADAISYSVKHLKPNQLIDLATLTGSVVQTLGYSSAGLFTNNEEMANELSAVGELIKERVWRLPLYSEFGEELHSDIADLKNLTMKPIAGAINAAKFLEAFTEDHEAWAHLDIAGVAFGDSEYAKMKSATGFGVRLLIEYLRR